MMMFCALDVPAAVCTGIVYRTSVACSEVAFWLRHSGERPVMATSSCSRFNSVWSHWSHTVFR